MARRSPGRTSREARGEASAAPVKLKQPIRIARIGAAHGVRGECRVKPFTENPEAIGDYGPLVSEDGRLTLTVAGLRVVKNGMLVVRFEEITDRTRVEALNRTDLYVERDALGAAGEDDEFFVADLIGLEVVDAGGTAVGKVAEIADFGAGDILDIELTDGGNAMLPFTKDFVPEIDFGARRIVIDPPEGWDGG